MAALRKTIPLRKTAPRRRLAIRLRELRLASGLSQERAANQLRISRKQWIEIESGRQSIPAERIVDFANVVNSNINVLLETA